MMKGCAQRLVNMMGRDIARSGGKEGCTHYGSYGRCKSITIDKQLIVSMWVHEKGQNGVRCDKIRVNFALHLNKAAPTKANLCKLERQAVLTGSVLHLKCSGWPQKYADVSACLEESVLQLPKKIHEK